jgi:hypothetical protein
MEEPIARHARHADRFNFFLTNRKQCFGTHLIRSELICTGLESCPDGEAFSGP